MRTFNKTLPTTTPEEFCLWLHKWIEGYNRRAPLSDGWRMLLDFPPSLDILSGTEPYIIDVMRKPQFWGKSMSYDAFGNPHQRIISPPSYELVTLKLEIFKVGPGIKLVINCNDGYGLSLEGFVNALETLPQNEKIDEPINLKQLDAEPLLTSSGSGRNKLSCHEKARQRLRNGEPETKVRNTWREEYFQEKDLYPNETKSGESVLWYKSVTSKL